MSYKKWAYLLVILFTLLSFLTIIINYVVDPFQHYRISSWYKITNKRQREVSLGLARNFHAKTAIIGSSMVENFQASKINTELNTSTVKLCMSGMTTHEMHYVIKEIIDNNPNIKNIILSLDFYALSVNNYRTQSSGFPYYLVDNNLYNDIFYLLDKKTLRFSFRMLMKERNKETSFDNMWYWGNYYKYSKDVVLKNYDPKAPIANFKSEFYTSDIFINSFNFNLLPFIKKYNNIKFTVIYPPYSYIMYKDMKNKNWMKDVFSFKTYLAKLSYKNLEIYDFQCVQSITNNLNNYRDIAHYRPEINDFMIESIKNKKYLININNINKCLKQIRLSADK